MAGDLFVHSSSVGRRWAGRARHRSGAGRTELRNPVHSLLVGLVAGLAWLVITLAILRAFAWERDRAERACAAARQFISYGISGAPAGYGYTYDPCATADAYAPWGGGQGW